MTPPPRKRPRPVSSSVSPASTARPSLTRYVDALRAGLVPPRELEPLGHETRARERLLLGLRLDQPVIVADVAAALDLSATERLAERGLVEVGDGAEEIRLTERGRYLGGGVTAELMRLACA